MLDAIVNDLNTVAEGFRSAYKEKDGKFYLQVTPVGDYALENIKGLRTALDSERGAKEQAESRLRAFDGLDSNAARNAISNAGLYGDITPEAAKNAVAEVARLTAIDPAKEADKLAQTKIDAAKRGMEGAFKTKEDEYKGQIEAGNTRNKSLTDQLRTLLVSNEIKGQLNRLKVLDDLADAAELLAERSIRTVEKDGKFEVQVVDVAGNVRHKLDGSTPVLFTVADLMDEIKQTRPGLFQAENRNGVGITPGNGGQPRTGGQVNPWAKETFNRTQQAVITNKNPVLAAQMKSQAGVA